MYLIIFLVDFFSFGPNHFMKTSHIEHLIAFLLVYLSWATMPLGEVNKRKHGSDFRLQ